MLEEARQDLQLPCLKLPSGAGHDALFVSRLAPMAMVFVPCRAGKSHCPEEWAKMAGLRDGADTLLLAVRKFDTLQGGPRAANDRQALGHTQVQTTARYTHLAAEPVWMAADAVAQNLRQFLGSTRAEARHLERVLEILGSARQEDPKGRAVLHYLDQENWLQLGCIIFSQYYDTVRWIGGLITATHSGEPVAVYAGLGKSGVLLDGEWRTMDREDIEKGVKERKLRVVCATDAACKGLNLQP